MKAVLKPKRGVLLEIWIQFSSLKKKKKSQSSGLSGELCITILSAPSNMPGGFLSILLHFFIPFPAQHNAAITQSMLNRERERKEGRNLPSNTAPSVINNRMK